MLNETDVQQLRSHCQIDAMSSNICSRRAFWVKLFDEQSLFLPNYQLTTPEEWLIEYEKELIIRDMIRKLYTIIINVGEIYFRGISFDNSTFNQINPEFKLLWKKWLIVKYEGLNNDTPEPQGKIFYHNNQIHISFLFATITTI